MARTGVEEFFDSDFYGEQFSDKCSSWLDVLKNQEHQVLQQKMGQRLVCRSPVPRRGDSKEGAGAGRIDNRVTSEVTE